MGLVSQALEAIPVYTGLSPGTFFTVLALVVAAYYLISGLLAPPPFKSVPMEPLPPPVQLGDVTLEELAEYDGRDSKKQLLMAIKGQIYDVSQSRTFYGPGGPYALFAGKDASRALAKMSFEEKDLTGDLEGLSPYELEALTDWEYKFIGKYNKVGQIKGSGKVNGEEKAAEEATETEVPRDDSPVETEAQ
jgi:membrane-associated progesterone receptor component